MCPFAPKPLIRIRLGFVETLINQQLAAFGYNSLGLGSAQLIQGSFVAAHVFGWTEFGIDAVSQALTVTTYGIDAYSQADLTSPATVVNRQPQIVSQFRVTPR